MRDHAVRSLDEAAALFEADYLDISGQDGQGDNAESMDSDRKADGLIDLVSGTPEVITHRVRLRVCVTGGL